ncbi:MAG TPA: response regulator transcription factor, partial [Candidatus Xenobia bacterium]
MIRVVIVDDQSVFREMLLATLAEEEDLSVVGQASNGEEAIMVAGQVAPDVMLMDINMPKMNGITATSAIVKSHPQTKVVIVTAFDDDTYVSKLIAAGATGYVLKESSPAQIVKAVRAAHSGEAIIEPRLLPKILKEFSRLKEDSRPGPAPAVGALTDREREVLVLIGNGRNNKEIGEKLFISEPTVKTHVANLMHKLNFRDRIEAVIFAMKNGLV